MKQEQRVWKQKRRLKVAVVAAVDLEQVVPDVVLADLVADPVAVVAQLADNVVVPRVVLVAVVEPVVPVVPDNRTLSLYK
jgi:hypothetical protein